MDGHVLAYLADCVDKESGAVLVWDLTNDTKFEATLYSVQAHSRQTRAPTHDEKHDAADDLGLRLGEKVNVLRNLS